MNGSPPLFNPTMLNQCQLLFETRSMMRKGETHICLFLTKPLPDKRGCAIYVSFDAATTREYAGFLSNVQPSRIFKIAAPLKSSRGDSRGEMEVDMQEQDEEAEVHLLRIGLDLEDLQLLEERKEIHDAAKRERQYWSKQFLLEANRMPEQVSFR